MTVFKTLMMHGRVTFKNLGIALAPSITAASSKSLGTVCKAAKSITIISGVCFQTAAAMTAGMAVFISPIQLIL